jgi:hypothetical protein
MVNACLKCLEVFLVLIAALPKGVSRAVFDSTADLASIGRSCESEQLFLDIPSDENSLKFQARFPKA